MSAAAVAAGGPPARLPVPRQALLGLHNFGLQFHWGALLAVAIPAIVLTFTSEAAKGRVLGSVLAGGALVALVMQPLAGAFSDRSLHPRGRRRPFIAAGVLLNAAALLGLVFAPSLVLFALAFLAVEFAYNLGAAAYGGLIPDLVPPAQRGAVSGFWGLAAILGTILGGLVAGRLVQEGQTLALILVVAGVLLATMAVTVWRVKEEPLRARPPFVLGEFLREFGTPFRHPNFTWLFSSRFLTLMGFYTLLAFLLFFLQDYLRIPRFTEATGQVQAMVAVGALIVAYPSGWLSDRVGRRPIVSCASLLMGVMVLVFLLAPSFRLLLVLGAIFGLGYGAFNTVDLALAVDVLPSPEAAAAKDLGIWGVSTTLPQVLGPLLGGVIRDAAGYFPLFTLAAAYFVLGALAIWKIRTR